MARFAVVKRGTDFGFIYYVAPGELILEANEESMFISSDLDECDLKKQEFEENEKVGGGEIYG